MTQWDRKTLGQRVDDAILSSSATQALHRFAEHQRSHSPRLPTRPSIAFPLATLVIALVALCFVLFDGNAEKISGLVLAGCTALLSISLLPGIISRTFRRAPDEHECAIARSANTAGFMTVSVMAMFGFWILSAQALLSMKTQQQLGIEAGLFVLFFLIVFQTVPPLYKWTKYRNAPEE